MFRTELEKFVQKITLSQFQGQSSEIETYCNPGDLTEGLSGHPVFFVKSGNKLLFLVKAFLEENEALAFSFLSGGNFISTIPLKESHAAKPLAHERYEKDSIKLILIAIEKAPGSSLNSLLKEAGGTNDPLIRKSRIENLIHALEKVANAFAELHTIRSDQGHVISPYYEQNDLKQLHDFIHTPRCASTFPEIITTCKKLQEQILQGKITASKLGFIHGDANPGNLFYEEKERLLTLTDLDQLMPSVDRKGNPAGPIAFDYIFFLCSLRFASVVHHLTSEEGKQLENIFIERYKEKIGNRFPSDKTLEYYQTLFWIRKLFLIATASTHLKPEMRRQIEIQQKMAISQLEDLCRP